MQSQRLLKIQYGNIQQKKQLEDIIEELKDRIQQVIQQIHTLSTKQNESQTHHIIITNKMENIIIENRTKILELEKNIQEIAQKQQRKLKQLQDQKQKTKKNLQTTHANEVNQYIRKIQQLEIQYKGYKEKQQKEAQYIKKIDQIKASLIQKQYKHHDRMNIEEKNQKGINDTLIEDNTTLVKETKKTAIKVARNIVLQQKQFNQQKNQQLKLKLFQLQTQLSKLKKQRDDILERRKQIKINVCLNEDQLQQYKAVGSLQKSKIKNYQQKIDNLKKLIQTEVSKKQNKLNQRKKQRESNLKTIKLKIHNLQKQYQQKRIEGQKLQILGSTILEQRKEVQNFFLMAMDACKKQIDTKQEKNQQQKQYGQKVDIQQLLPKDKQRIITNLYAKLALDPR